MREKVERGWSESWVRMGVPPSCVNVHVRNGVCLSSWPGPEREEAGSMMR